MGEKELAGDFLSAVKGLGPVAKGSLCQFRRKCGKASCKKCSSGEGHLSYKLTFVRDGASCTRFVGPSQVEAMRQAIGNGRKLERLILDFGLDYLKHLKNRQ
jgi:hypothetical protein